MDPYGPHSLANISHEISVLSMVTRVSQCQLNRTISKSFAGFYIFVFGDKEQYLYV